MLFQVGMRMVAARFAIKNISCKLIIMSVGEATHAGTPLLALAARDDQFVVFRYCVHLLVEFVVCFVLRTTRMAFLHHTFFSHVIEMSLKSVQPVCTYKPYNYYHSMTACSDHPIRTCKLCTVTSSPPSVMQFQNGHVSVPTHPW